MRCWKLFALATFALLPLGCGGSDDEEPDTDDTEEDAGADDDADDDDADGDAGGPADDDDDDVVDDDPMEDAGGPDDDTPDETDAGPIDVPEGDAGGEPIDDPPAIADWPTDGLTLIELDDDGHGAASSTFDGAEALSELDWAKNPDVACWDADIDDEFFSAEHVAFALAEPVPEWSEVTITITPEDGAEANLYVIEMPQSQADVPPDVEEATFCYVPVQLGSPGAESSVTFRTYAGDAHIMFGVSHRGRFNGGDTAAFDVDVQVTELEDADRCYAEVDQPFQYPGNTERVQLDEDGKAVFAGNLGDGAPVCDNAYINDQFCAPTTRFDMFGGNHVFYAIDGGIADHTILSVTVTPDPGVDVSLYGAWQGTTNFYVPPNFLVGGCEASYVATFPGAEVTSNPGESESITINAINNPFNIFFAVSGTTEQGASGGYTVSIETIDTSTNDCSEDDYNAVVGLEEWPSSVQTIPITIADGEGTAQVQGDLADGASQCTLDWAANSSVACFPLTQSDYFSGNHLFYALEEAPPPGSSVVFRAIPEPDVEVSLYAYRIGASNFLVPPYVPSVVQCEASHDFSLSHPPNPGVTEEVAFYGGSNPYNYFVGVAGYRDAEASGAFTLEVEIVEPPPPHCPESLPGATYATWPSTVEIIELDDDGVGTGSGDLSSGACVNLDFAQNSSVACFPSPHFEHFEGNHVFHAVEQVMPPNSEMTVTVTPRDDAEVNLYGFQTGTMSFPVPPNIPSVIACEASYDSTGPNPGEPESIYFANPTENNSYQVSFVVAGDADTGTGGEYDIEVELNTSTIHCEESLPGESGLTDWASNVELVTLNAEGGASTPGDLGDGECMNLTWAENSSVACFPATRFDRFDGNHVYYALEEPMPPNSVLTLTLRPDDGVDANLYGYQMGTDDFLLPPAVPSVVACEASYPSSPFENQNPGEVEVINFYNPSDSAMYNIFYAVAGGLGADTGGYTVETQLHVGATHCEESLPGQSHSQWPGSVEQLSIGTDGFGSENVAGDLSSGSCMNLSFASDSATACFPATQDPSFEGNQVYYAFDIPGQSEVTISLTSPNDVMNLYGYMIGDDSYFVPPYVPSTIFCEASLPPFTNPADDVITFLNTLDVPRNVFFAVSGETGVDSGAFDVTIDVAAAQ